MKPLVRTSLLNMMNIQTGKFWIITKRGREEQTGKKRRKKNREKTKKVFEALMEETLRGVTRQQKSVFRKYTINSISLFSVRQTKPDGGRSSSNIASHLVFFDIKSKPVEAGLKSHQQRK